MQANERHPVAALLDEGDLRQDEPAAVEKRAPRLEVEPQAAGGECVTGTVGENLAQPLPSRRVLPVGVGDSQRVRFPGERLAVALALRGDGLDPGAPLLLTCLL